ncbi:MAG TPA: TolC family protein [Chitinophagales bacterium]|nr:TolC family protein [Chitinophagales bacterium]
MQLQHFLHKKYKPFKLNGSVAYSKNQITVLISVLILFMSMTLNAQNILTLKQAINNGLANRKNITAGKSDMEIRKLQTKAMYSKFWPQVSVEYNYLYNPILQTSILPIGVFNPSYPADATKSVQFGTKWTQSAGLTVNQPLLDLSIKRNINEAKLQEKIAALSQAQTEYELAYSIAQTYIDIYLQDSKIKAAIADTNRTYLSYNLQKNKFDEKRLLKSDLNSSKINHNNTVQILADDVAQLIEDKVYLLFLMGLSNLEKWDFTIDTNALNYSFTTLESSPTFDELPELQQLTLQSQLTNLQAKTEKSKHIPTISLKGFIGANQYTNTFNPVAANSWFGLSYVGLNVKFPLLFGENQHAKLQQLKLQANQYTLQKEDKTAQYAKDVFTAKLRIENINTQLKTQQENIALSVESITIFQARVSDAQESASTLNLQEVNLQILEADYETNKKQLSVYWLNYLKAAGQLSVLWK